MRVMVDTNVLFSAILFPKGQAANAFTHCLLNHELVISTYVINELKQVISKKKPEMVQHIDVFLEKLSFELVYTPDNIEAGLFSIRDPKDYPVLYTAIIENVDVLISGDKDLKYTDITHPEILTPAGIFRKILTLPPFLAAVFIVLPFPATQAVQAVPRRDTARAFSIFAVY